MIKLLKNKPSHHTEIYSSSPQRQPQIEATNRAREKEQNGNKISARTAPAQGLANSRIYIVVGGKFKGGHFITV
jgi:hypothetical protein